MRGSRARSALWFAAALVPPALLAFAIARLAVNVPYWDDWRWADMVVKFDEHRLTFADLWHPEVEHRILVPSVLALVLSRAGGYNTIVESFFSWACSLASLGCLFILLRRTLPQAYVGPVLVVQSVLLFSLAQLTTYLWGFQLGWTVVNLLALLVLVALCGKRLGVFEFGGAFVAALAASLSLAQGLLVFGVGLLAIAARRPLPRRFALTWAACAFAALGFILPGISLAQPGPSVFSSTQLMRIATFPVVLGAPIAGWLGALGAAVAGLAAIWGAWAFGSRFDSLRREDQPEALRRTPWLGLALFGVCGSLLIALGRGVLGLDYGLQERYLTLASMAWIGLLPLAILQFEASRNVVLGRARVPVLLAIGVLAFSLSNQYVSTLPRALAAHEQRLAQFELVRGYAHVDGATLIDQLFPNPSAREFMRATDFPSPDDVPALIAALASQHEGPFVTTR